MSKKKDEPTPEELEKHMELLAQLQIPIKFLEISGYRQELLATANEIRRHLNKPSCFNCEHRRYSHCTHWDDTIPVEFLETGCDAYENEVPF